MRHLNKIIFLQSANIPYAEVLLDGNVHFSGTQGVGKSTVLRALLFFYNADKMRLGIQQGQKSFEEFYFRHSNSYIVYEVKTDQSAYTILTLRSQGKAVFRFIDAPYRREWFVGDDGKIESDWIRIRSKITESGAEISNLIDTYEQYRNIIFGNTHDRSHRYDKYALVKSSKYQNIPRSIQNVFLNSKLDADFVKNTIIQSMTEVEASIDLTPYRRLVSEFEREFEEIECWYKKDSNGDILVRTKASKVIDTYRLLVALEHQIRQTWHQLNYAVKQTHEQKPILEDEIRGIKEELGRISEKRKGLDEKFKQEHEELRKEINNCDLRLSDIEKKRKYYNNIRIDEIIALNEQEPKFKSERTQKERQLQALEEQYNDVTQKYRILYDMLDSEWGKIKQSLEEELQRFRDSIQTKRDEVTSVRNEKDKTLLNAYEQWLSSSNERLSTLHEEKSRADKRLAELDYWHPLEKEMSACKEEIRQLENNEDSLKNQLESAGKELNSIRQEGQMKCEKEENDFARHKEKLQEEINKAKEELTKIEEILSRWNGSLYEWLSQNKPGWEENIGKIVDEQQVLYAQGLSPILSDGNSLYGVDINLDAIPVHHRTPDEYRALQKEQKAQIAKIKKDLEELEDNYKKKVESINRSYNKIISELKQKETNLRFELEQIPTKLKDKKTILYQLDLEEKEKVSAERMKRTAVYEDAILRLDRENTARKEQLHKYDGEKKEVEKEYKLKIAELQKQYDDFKHNNTIEKEEKKKAIDERKSIYEEQERNELKGRGADTKAIQLCKQDIETLKQTLDKIEKERSKVFEYRKDERELFVHESEYVENKRRFEAKEALANEEYESQKKSLDAEKIDKLELQKSKEAAVNVMNEGLKQYEQLCKIENIIPESFYQDNATMPSTLPCTELVPQMRGAVNKKRQKMTELKNATNSFNSHFGPKNTFSFITPQEDKEYLDFAVNLQDFIENDKIDTYRSLLSEHYKDILNSISREIGALMDHTATVHNIIKDINNDFQKRNFAGVIQSIELSAENSQDRIIKLLCKIQEFTSQNSYNMGEVNLFSSNEHDSINSQVVEYLKRFMKQLLKEPSRTEISLSDAFSLQFRVKENDNDTGWVERINNVGSDGTDILVKAMVNIMLINVFKTRASRQNGDFFIHCMMDEIGKLHPNNVKGILKFANDRNIYLINSSPMGFNSPSYKYNYLLTKDGKSQTHIARIATIDA